METMAHLLATMAADPPPKKVVGGNPQLFSAELVDTDKLNAGTWGSSVGSWEIASWSVNEIMIIQSGRSV